MGIVGDSVRKRARKQNIQQAILTTIKVAGLISVAALAPNTLQLLKYLPQDRSRATARIGKSRQRLEEKMLIRLVGNGPNQKVKLTAKGERLCDRLALGKARYVRPARWDGKWRIVMFDVSERHRLARDRLRATLAAIGFIKLQESVWIFPYDCEDIISLFKADFQFGREVLYIVTEDMEGERWLRSLFGLRASQY